METYFGYVDEVKDNKKFVIKFTVKNIIEKAIAYPIDTFDEPNIGDPVIIYAIESIFGWSFMWKKLRLKDHTRMKLLESLIDIYDDHIEIHAGGTEEANPGDDAQSLIWIDKDGSISVKAKKEVTVETPKVTVKGKNTVDIETTTCTINAIDVNITGGNLTTTNGGICSPTGVGGFCGIPICPLTGSPHIGNKITGT